jgi:integrase
MPRPRTVPGNVYQRKTGRWVIWFWDRSGKRHRCAAKAADEASARAELAAILGRMAKGEDPVAAELTLDAWARRWIESRRAAGKGEADNEAAHVTHHIAPELGRVKLRELSTAQVLDFVRRLPAHAAARGGGPISATTAWHIAGTLKLCMRDAAKRGLIPSSPCVWDASDLPERGAPAVGEGFSEAEVERLISDTRIPEDRRVLYALEFLTGMRTGEAAARRWRDWDPSRAPLGALKVDTSWSTKRQLEKATKTRVTRTIPVHPVLAELLERWRAEGWPRAHGRAPAPEDLVVPAPDGAPRANTSSWRDFQRDLAALGLARQRHYESRSTFLSLAEGGGADLATVRLLTHPSPKSAADLYRRQRILWPKLCESVRTIRVGEGARAA